MARIQYFVVGYEDAWKISVDGEHEGPYATQAQAIRIAVDRAHRSGGTGHDAQVLVQGEDRRFRTEWTYGADPYPPAG